jgi:hypothetical protein
MLQAWFSDVRKLPKRIRTFSNAGSKRQKTVVFVRARMMDTDFVLNSVFCENVRRGLITECQIIVFCGMLYFQLLEKLKIRPLAK